MFGILEAVAVPQAGVFPSYEELISDLNGRMAKEGYKVVKTRSHRGRLKDGPGNGEISRCDLVCDRGGRPYKCQATKHKTSTKKTNCPWNAKAVYRKAINGWVLTITCDQHNHEPGTPEPPTPSEVGDGDEQDAEMQEQDEDGPRPDTETAAALQVAGVSDSVIRLSGDTFHQFKNEYRKMYQADRFNMLSQLQLRIAAIYAVQNEELQRQRRRDLQDKRHRDIEESRSRLVEQRRRARRTRPQGDQQVQASPQQQDAQQTPQQLNPRTAQQQGQFHIPPNTEFIFPVPGFDSPASPVFPGPPKRIRGHRPSQTPGSTSGENQSTT